jgi:hypothetical protein
MAPNWTQLLHPEVEAAIFPGSVFCGDGYCAGGCGLPALTLRLYYSEKDANAALSANAAVDERGYYHDLKAMGSQVASGPVWQRRRWEGARVYLPDEYIIPHIAEMWWH